MRELCVITGLFLLVMTIGFLTSAGMPWMVEAVEASKRAAQEYFREVGK